ncbi:MAG: PIN domain-containing protein [Planctomycetota bacterium]
METFDTNVVLRMVYSDDEAQASRATRAWRKAVASGGIFLTTTVLVELAWVLRVAARFDRAAIASALRRVCDSQVVSVEDEPRVRRALARYEGGSADFSD